MLDGSFFIRIFLIQLPQNLLYAYFLSQFLYAENRKKAFLQITLFYQILIPLASVLLWYQLSPKFIMNLVLLTTGIFLFFRRERLFRKILASFLLVAVILIVEMLLTGVYLVIEGTPPETFGPIYIYLIQFVLFFTLYTVLIRLFNREQFISTSFMRYILICCIIQVCYLYGGTMIFTRLFYTKAYMYMLVLFLLASLLLFLYTFYLLFKQKQKEQSQQTQLMLQKEYEQQLHDYMDLKEEDQIRRLRHDLLNYWNTRS